MIAALVFKLALALYTMIAASINILDQPHEPESRPDLAEVCYFEDHSAIWVAIIDPIGNSDMEVCDEGAYVLGYVELPNSD